MKNLNTVSAGRKTVSMEQKEKKLAVILIAPAVIYLILIMGLPLIWAVYTSLTDKVIGAAQVNFVGLSNYIEIIKDPVFQKFFVDLGNGLSCAVEVNNELFEECGTECIGFHARNLI